MKKSDKTKERDKILEEYYNDRSWVHSMMTEQYMERRLNDQRFGVFGNALLTVVMIAVIVGVLFLVLYVF